MAAAFTEDAVVRINRTFGNVEQALAEKPDTEALSLSGALTETEIRDLVPYLLRLDRVAIVPSAGGQGGLAAKSNEGG